MKARAADMRKLETAEHTQTVLSIRDLRQGTDVPSFRATHNDEITRAYPGASDADNEQNPWNSMDLKVHGRAA